ncbi:sodium:calcium antiporter [bacterium]|nr:sodium:calcium antiporter [bacterium]
MLTWPNDNLLWTQFLLCGTATVFAGAKLSRYGDIIGEKLDIGKTWIGLVLLAAVTSMPEMITSCTAGGIGAADIAVGNIFGSNVFNLAILGILGVLMPRAANWDDRGRRHLLAGALSLLIISLALISIIAYNLMAPDESSVGWTLKNAYIGPGTLLIMGAYLLSMYLLFSDERSRPAETEREMYGEKSLVNACIGFSVFAIVIISSGYRMVLLGDLLAVRPISILGPTFVLGQSVIGTFFLAIATSLPELTVCIAAVRMGSADMAVGNIFGSNIFNIAALFFADLFFVKGPILAHVSNVHVLTGILAIVITVVFILGSTYRRLFPGFKQMPMSLAIVILWLCGWILIFSFGSG